MDFFYEFSPHLHLLINCFDEELKLSVTFYNVTIFYKRLPIP